MSTAVMFNSATWSDEGTSLRLDIICLAVALTLHVPLYFMKFDARKKVDTLDKERLVSVDIIEPELEKKVELPPPPPEPKGPSLADKVKALFKKETPPPPPPKAEIKLPEKIADVPKEIKLDPKLDAADKLQPKLQTKAGFQASDPKLVIDQQKLLKTSGAGIAPLSAQKLGTLENRDPLKNNKGNFQIAKADNVQAIGGDVKGGLSDPTAPTISLRTGQKGSTEKFSAPPPQKTDKGKIGAIGDVGLGDQKLGLRDSIIARDAAPSQINTSGSKSPLLVSGSGAGGSKVNAGSFQGSGTGSSLGSAPTQVTAPKIAAPAIAAPVKRKKEMIEITGELKNRARISQELPSYPAWAEERGIEASVILECAVEAGGIVKENIVVVRSSGYPELDELARKALRRWKFVPVTDGSNRTEVGRITFNYTLN